MRWLFSLLMSMTAAGGAQQPAALFEQAPPAVEEALRARVKAFWDAQIAGKYRVADGYVAEEAKDAYFGMDKSMCRSWGFQSAVFEENFTKARAVILCETVFSHSGRRTSVTMPLTNFWKVIDGQWFWYVPPAPADTMTPFGKMKAGEKTTDGAPATGNTAGTFRLPTVEDLLKQVEFSRRYVNLRPSEESSDEFTLTNKTGGPIQLSPRADSLPGLSVQIEKMDLPAGESTKVFVKYTPKGGLRTIRDTFAIHMNPLNQDMPIEARFEKPLTRSLKETNFVVDEMAKVPSPFSRNDIKISASEPFNIWGWATDTPNRALAYAVEVWIDGLPHHATYQMERVDVAEAFKNPVYEKSGFRLDLPPGRLAKGGHQVFIRIIASTRDVYYDTPTIMFLVE